MYCPFAGGSRAKNARIAERWRAQPSAGVLSIWLELLALNPKMRLFGATCAWDLAIEHQLDEPVALARNQLAAARWALYEVRRTWTSPNQATRSVRTLATGSRTRMQSLLVRTAPGWPQVDRYGIHRVWLRPPGAGPRTVEHLWAVAACGIADKQRPRFEQTWQHLTEPEVPSCGIG